MRAFGREGNGVNRDGNRQGQCARAGVRAGGKCWGDPSFLLEGDAQGENYVLHNMACAPSCRGSVVSPVDLPRAGLCVLSLWAYVS